jgi:hypothetical protein
MSSCWCTEKVQSLINYLRACVSRRLQVLSVDALLRALESVRDLPGNVALVIATHGDSQGNILVDKQRVRGGRALLGCCDDSWLS